MKVLNPIEYKKTCTAVVGISTTRTESHNLLDRVRVGALEHRGVH